MPAIVTSHAQKGGGQRRPRSGRRSSRCRATNSTLGPGAAWAMAIEALNCGVGEPACARRPGSGACRARSLIAPPTASSDSEQVVREQRQPVADGQDDASCAALSHLAIGQHAGQAAQAQQHPGQRPAQQRDARRTRRRRMTMHSGTPSGCFFKAPTSFRPVAVIRPAATAPMPRSAPATCGLSATGVDQRQRTAPPAAARSACRPAPTMAPRKPK